MTMQQCSSICKVILLFGAMLLLVGCGGGHSGSGGPTGGSTLTEQTRTAVLAAIAVKYDTLPQANIVDDANTLLAFLRTRSEFSKSGIARDNSVWARFTDGRPLVIMLNDVPLKPNAVQAIRSRSPLPTRSASGDPLEIPASNKVYLVNTREPNDPAVTQVFDKLENDYLPTSSYQPIVIEGTIEHLKVINNAGVLYNIGHAGLGYKGLPRDDPGTPEYAFGTLTPRTPGSDTTYNDDLTNGRVGYLIEPTIVDRVTGMPLSRYKLASGYFITDLFVTKYWTFSANSLFISDNCDGGSAEAQPFIQACFGKGLSAYLGWDNAVANSDANESALFLLDRILGYNDLSAARQPEHPQQRPFNYFNILDQMTTLPRVSGSTAGTILGTTLTTSFSIDSVGYGFIKGGKANLKDFQNQADGKGNFGLLNPTISNAVMVENDDQIILQGTFGSDPKTDSHAVLIGGKDVTTQTTWTQERLTINNVPVSGAGSSGDISVSVRGHVSNVVQLTSWRGTFTAVQKRNGAEILTTKYNVHLRGILNFLRGTPGKDPLPPAPMGCSALGEQRIQRPPTTLPARTTWSRIWKRSPA
ncbi:MAG: hypothetical protein JWN14_2699 [Chthonomonadales bacterium]|nr:hypothetical protein [Chthonomonadales bacterium]